MTPHDIILLQGCRACRDHAKGGRRAKAYIRLVDVVLLKDMADNARLTGYHVRGPDVC